MLSFMVSGELLAQPGTPLASNSGPETKSSELEQPEYTPSQFKSSERNTPESTLRTPLTVHFKITPRMCVLSEKEAYCNDELSVFWESSSDADICLFQLGLDQAMRCWQAVDRGRYTFVLSTRSDVKFQLRHEQTDAVLATKAFLVTHSHKKYRRARRNPWSFF